MGYPDPTAQATQSAALINAERKRKGKAALRLDARLSYYATQHSKAMGTAQKIWDPTYAELQNAVKGWEWKALGGNVGETPWSADLVKVLHAAFMNSHEHYVNIVDGRFTRVGIGFRTVNHVTFETQIFFG